ncbi:HesA/MoeB/ThiF family protein [Moraxella sp. ZY200743]|uniref:HesA/MoeB/ThiF family protein n=1 Tax=Moraxella sp. ZY200743 TaxID=2911970 RepID=UPI003D7E3EC6
MIDVLSDAELMRYSRQILLDDWDLSAQLELKKSHVLIVGMGGLGCPISQILVRAGVGCLHLVDFDVIDESNLQRQTLFTADDVGRSKVAVAHQKLAKHNELVRIVSTDIRLTNDNIGRVFDECAGRLPNLVIDCTDNFAIRDLLNQACQTYGVPLLSSSAIGEVGQLALFTNKTGCYQCLFGTDKGDEMTCATSGVLGSTVSVIASMASQVALDFLGRHHNPIEHQLVLWHGREFSLKKIRFTQDEHCTICNKQLEKSS